MLKINPWATSYIHSMIVKCCDTQVVSVWFPEIVLFTFSKGQRGFSVEIDNLQAKNALRKPAEIFAVLVLVFRCDGCQECLKNCHSLHA